MASRGTRTPGSDPRGGAHPGCGTVCLYSEELKAVFAGDVLMATGPVPHHR